MKIQNVASAIAGLLLTLVASTANALGSTACISFNSAPTNPYNRSATFRCTFTYLAQDYIDYDHMVWNCNTKQNGQTIFFQLNDPQLTASGGGQFAWSDQQWCYSGQYVTEAKAALFNDDGTHSDWATHTKTKIGDAGC